MTYTIHHLTPGTRLCQICGKPLTSTADDLANQRCFQCGLDLLTKTEKYQTSTVSRPEDLPGNWEKPLPEAVPFVPTPMFPGEAFSVPVIKSETTKDWLAKVFPPFEELSHFIYARERWGGYDENQQPKFQILRAHEIVICYGRYSEFFTLYAVQDRKRTAFTKLKLVFFNKYKRTTSYTKEGYEYLKQELIQELTFCKRRIEELLEATNIKK